MLKIRVLTALVLLPLALLAIFGLPANAFSIGLGLILLIGSWEFHRLAALRPFPGGALLFSLQSAVMVLMFLTWERWTVNPIPTFATASFAWLLLLLQLRWYRPERGVTTGYRLRGFVNALVVITAGWMSLSFLRREPDGEWWILLLLLTIWAADTGAYFFGRALGNRKLAPGISPGKTWAGFYGGIGSAALVTGTFGYLLPGIEPSPLKLGLIGAFTAFVSVGGDLFISLHKRTVGIKDTGRLFPGHGGVLDRLDSLMAGAAFFTLGKLLMGF